MSESLTQLQILQQKEIQWANEEIELSSLDIQTLFNIARRCLSAEERLERATKLLEELLETHNNCGIDEVPYGYGKVIDSVQAFLDRPKAIHPPSK
jgi:hypothetical protein